MSLREKAREIARIGTGFVATERDIGLVLAGMRAALERAKKKLAQPVPVQIVMDRLLDELEGK